MPRFAANLSMLYPEHAFLDRFAAAAQDGFAGVECLFPYAHAPAELAARAAAWAPKPRTYRGGYETLYVTHVQGADVGADLDFLVGRRGADVPRESH